MFDLAPLGEGSLALVVYTHSKTLNALRAWDVLKTIRLNDLEGLITFPSFHTANCDPVRMWRSGRSATFDYWPWW
jgi:hypothetical protein